MNETPNFDLPCMDANDTGAQALYMQRLAMDIDTKLKSQRDELTQALNRPVTIWKSNDTTTIFPGSEWTFFFRDAGNILFTNTTTPSSSIVPMIPGWWAFGVADLSTIPTGSPDNTQIVLILDAYSYSIAPGTRVSLGRWVETTFDSGTGGDNLQASASFYLPPGVTAYTSFSIVTSVQRSIQAGTMFWQMWLGSGDVSRRVVF